MSVQWLRSVRELNITVIADSVDIDIRIAQETEQESQLYSMTVKLFSSNADAAVHPSVQRWF